VAAVRASGRTSLWVDGRRAQDAEGPGPASFVMGDGLEGRLDEVAVYPRALPAVEIAAHAAAGPGADRPRRRRDQRPEKATPSGVCSTTNATSRASASASRASSAGRSASGITDQV
jgi:hypothetical protein